MVITPRETADERDDLVVLQSDNLVYGFTNDQLIDVDPMSRGARQLKCIGSFQVAVQTIASQNEGPGSAGDVEG